MATNHRDTLRNVRSITQLVAYLRDELEWPIEHDDMDDISDLVFDVNPTQLGLKPDVVAKIEYVKRFRPLDHNQPWAIYFVKFAPNNLPVAALRRILNSLSVRQRGGITNQTSNIWRPDDLLFISQYGEDSDRRITFAHFLNTPGKKDLPTLKVLGWDGDDTNLTLDSVAETLKTKLCWPTDTTDVDHWKKKWRSAFQLGHREKITSAKLMADKLAIVARNVRSRIEGALAVENDNGQLHMLMKSFKESLISDLTAASFADMFAQTISYGLLSARITNGSAKTADDLAAAMPITSPFLKELMATFLDISGRKAGAENGLDYDELGISEVVDLLDQANMEAVLRDFGNRNKDEDPVMHFFEGFLRAYDIKIKRDRGVFYTPQPVVSYIVRSVHELLQTEFGLEDGLADTTTWGEMLEKHPEMKLPPLNGVLGEKRAISPDEPFVQILDPATGTATFLVEVIDVIFKTMSSKWGKERKSVTEQELAWNDYVPKHLLPRLHAYELMMAPYAIAHMKVGLKLKETGYKFESVRRAQIYLTNALEPCLDQLPLTGFDALAHEVEAVNEVKQHKRFSVIIGNPPYAGHSSNNDVRSIVELVHDYRRGIPELQKPGQGKWLQDDYVKFFRSADESITTSTVGILGFVTNHSFIDNPTFRGMRRVLTQKFNTIHVLDLHGNSTKRESAPDGTTDENVFDIKQGVCITLAVKKNTDFHTVLHCDLYGSRPEKYIALAERSVCSTNWVEASASADFYVYYPQNSTVKGEYGHFYYLPKAMGKYGDPAPGIVSTHDQFAISWTRSAAIAKVELLLSTQNETVARSHFNLCSQSQWNYERAKADLNVSNWVDQCGEILYRPFDRRWTVYNAHVAVHRRMRVTRHLLSGTNVGLCIGKAGQVVGSSEWNLVSCTSIPVDFNFFYRGGACIFPLYLLPDENDLAVSEGKVVNFTRDFVETVRIGLDKSSSTASPTNISSTCLFNYIYSIVHSPSYRSRYAEFLKIDFPRLPLTDSIELFRSLSELGGQLVALHLVESHSQNTPITKYLGSSTEVEKPGWTDDNGGTVWLDCGGTKAKTTSGRRGFVGVTEAVWNFHIGGYQVCEKWLKDRKSRILSVEDIAHYHKIVVALSETIRIMQEIDEVINLHGGWPGAFQTAGNTTSTPVDYKYDERTPRAAEGTLFED